MSAAIFDASAYLKQLDPEASYSISAVSGGFVNVTSRAVKLENEINRGRFPGHASLILKYAPPYIAGRGDSAPFTQYRQTIEADALKLFAPDALSSIQDVCQASSVAVPAVLHHDPEAFVLVMSDLGRLPNLSDVFADLGGQSPGTVTMTLDGSLFSDSDGRFSHPQKAFFTDIGSRIGYFFARLHAPETCARVLQKHLLEHFEIPGIRDVTLQYSVKAVSESLKLFPGLTSDDEADRIGNTLVEDFIRETAVEERSFRLGDAWTAAVLVDPAILSAGYGMLGVIDWEFAAFGRGVHGDAAQFLAHFALLRISAAQDSPRYKCHTAAVDTVFAAFTRAYTQETAPGAAADDTLVSWSPPAPTSLRAVKMRSAFLAHGAEMVNVTFWKQWTCVSAECRQRTAGGSGKHTDIKHKCLLVRRLVECGLWYLQHAGEDVNAFCAEHNWAEIVDDSVEMRNSGHASLIDLFCR